jgi:hypothetical protein
MCHVFAAIAPAAALMEDQERHRAGTLAVASMTSLALPPETAPPRTSC